ncbi:MAG TPA: DHH family phosphoesterase [Spirochaetota bacterium]|nr:DHH family phosphoesterase [Spirochaetota bacterium]HOM09290.1 DHH family phosphoesterase [Spirochaetota bacterium]HPP49303.1 DHH family phosphoesterase [Spirochaetota bacterium]HXK65070.1 DHH family phosphoesterase [Spirochaetota bacterium]
MPKEGFKTAKQKNDCIEAIIQELVNRNGFLIVGHTNPDEDCVASMIAFSLLAKKFDKQVKIFSSKKIQENFKYLVDIAMYNRIDVVTAIPRSFAVDTIVICDTAKPSMIDANRTILQMLKKSTIRKIEIDHHIGADSDYAGDPGYRLVTEASSASELVGQIALKLRAKKEILKKYVILDPLSRNLVLAILTGIIGDSQMGRYLKSSREKRMYRIFSTLFNDILSTSTIKESNITNMNQIFEQLKQASEKEKHCFQFIKKKSKVYKSVGYAMLTEDDMRYLYENFDDDDIISTTRTLADMLAEDSGKVGLVSYYDIPEKSNLVQFRMRRSQNYKNYDLREFLTTMGIENGGGHEGAIGFRLPKHAVDDYPKFVTSLVKKINALLP